MALKFKDITSLIEYLLTAPIRITWECFKGFVVAVILLIPIAAIALLCGYLYNHL